MGDSPDKPSQAPVESCPGDVHIDVIIPRDWDNAIDWAQVSGIIERKLMSRKEARERWPSEFPLNDPRNTCGAY